MIKSKKQSLIVIGVFTLVLALVTTTYAFFNYTRTGTANTIRVGRISFVSKNEETITLNNLFPIDPSNTSDLNDNTKVGTYSIDIKGDTDYVDGIEYLVSAVDANIYTSEGQIVPITLDFTVTDLGDPSTNYFTERENTNVSIYKKLVGDTLVGDQMLLVGYIKPNTTSGTAEGVDGNITIKAYLDKNKILISDTYDGTESDNMGTPNSMAQGKTVLTTSEWNALKTSGISFKVKVEANEGIWVVGSLEEIMRVKNYSTTLSRGIRDDESSTFVSSNSGINFGEISSDTNGKGVYMRAGTQNDTNPILYYRGVIEDNNVIFNNKCWKTVRTTDTGGVKLIYNGETGNVYEKIALSENQYTVVTNTDGTNNDVWTFDSTDNSWNISYMTGSIDLSFTVPAGDGYILEMTGQNSDTGSGYYGFYKDGNGVKGGSINPKGAISINYTYGSLTSDDVVEVFYFGSGLTTPSTIKIRMISLGDLITDNGCDNTGENTHISVNNTNTFKFNSHYDSPAYVGYMHGTIYPYSVSNWTSGARFGSRFTYDGTNYTLVDDSLTTPNATHHYSCNVTTESGTCQELRYVYYMSGNTKYYITLSGGKGIEEAIQDMLINETNSNAKNMIETWYMETMNNVTNKLEDTIWCNDRSIGRYNGWSATGTIDGDSSDYKNVSLLFNTFERSNYASETSLIKNQPTLSCPSKNDSFTWKNGKGNRKLEYPSAMLTEDEMVFAGGLAGISSAFYLNSGSKYWLLSSSNYDISESLVSDMISDGYISGGSVNASIGLRPAISIKQGQLITKGTGTVEDPYVIE